MNFTKQVLAEEAVANYYCLCLSNVIEIENLSLFMRLFSLASVPDKNLNSLKTFLPAYGTSTSPKRFHSFVPSY